MSSNLTQIDIRQSPPKVDMRTFNDGMRSPESKPRSLVSSPKTAPRSLIRCNSPMSDGPKMTLQYSGGGAAAQVRKSFTPRHTVRHEPPSIAHGIVHRTRHSIGSLSAMSLRSSAPLHVVRSNSNIVLPHGASVKLPIGLQRGRSPSKCQGSVELPCARSVVRREVRSASPVPPKASSQASCEGLDIGSNAGLAAARGSELSIGTTEVSLEDSLKGLVTSSPRHEDLVNAKEKTVDNLNIELKELKGILEQQFGKSHELFHGGPASLDGLLKTHLRDEMKQAVDEEKRATLQVELVQKVLALAPEGKVRELCAIVACQQVEQELFIRNMKANMDVLQEQVQRLMGTVVEGQANKPAVTQELPAGEDFNSLMKSTIDGQEMKLMDTVEGKIVQQETKMKSWFAEFCICAIKEIYGEDVQKHAAAIKSLNTQVTDLNEATKQSFASIQSLDMQVGDLNQVTKNSLESLRKLLTEGALSRPAASNQPGEYPRKLHTIEETPGEANDPDANLSPGRKFVKTGPAVMAPGATVTSSASVSHSITANSSDSEGDDHHTDADAETYMCHPTDAHHTADVAG